MRGDHALAYLTDAPWAITQNVLTTMLQVVEQRQDLEAVAARLGRPMEHTANEVEQRGSVAVMQITGPIFRRANFFSAVSGGTGIDAFGLDLTTVLEDPRIESILLNVDSPGGEAAGIAEMAQMIREASAKKPVWAYVGSQAYSGGYWLASAAEKIVMHRTAWAGSIGVIATVTDASKRRERDGYTEHAFVSSQSPNKRMDPNTDAGKSQLQDMVDEMADQFISQVADFRHVTVQQVKDDFGKGGVLVARRAIAVGMADEEGTYEGVIAQLNGRNQASGSALSIAANSVPVEVKAMADTTQPLDVNAIRAEERARIKAITKCEEADGRTNLAEHIAFNTDMDVQAARGFLAVSEKAVKVEVVRQEDQLGALMRGIPNPNVGASNDEPADDTAMEIQSITAFLPSAQRRRAS